MMETLGKLPVGEDTAGPDNMNHLNLQTSPSKEDGMVLPRFLKVWEGKKVQLYRSLKSLTWVAFSRS